MSDQSLIPPPAYPATVLLPADTPQVVALHWEDAIAGWSPSKSKNKNTNRNYHASMKLFFTQPVMENGQQRHMPQVLCDVTIHDLDVWLATLIARTDLRTNEEGHVAPNTVNRHIAAVRSFFTFWRNEPERHNTPNLIYVTFSSDAQDKTLPTLSGKTENFYAIIHPKHLAAVVDAAAMPQPITSGQEKLGRFVWEPKYRQGDALFAQRDAAIMTVALGTGLRVAELADLQIGDIYQREGENRLDWWVFVREGKGRKSRPIPMNDDVAEVLLAYIAATGRSVSRQSDREAPIWLGRLGKGLSIDHLRTIINSVIDRAMTNGDLPAGLNLSPHALRHTYAMMLLSGGATMVEVQQLLGHSNIATTQRYVQHLDDDRLAKLAPSLRRTPNPKVDGGE